MWTEPSAEFALCTAIPPTTVGWLLIALCASLLATALSLYFVFRCAKKRADLAERANLLKGQFLHRLSHEIRLPMDGVIGMTDLLLNTNLDSSQVQFARTVRDCAGNLLGILDDLLDYSRILDGQVSMQSCDFELHEVVDNVAQRYGPAAFAKNVELICFIHSDVPAVVRGDPGRFQQILSVLVGNAVRYTDAGMVMISVRSLESEGSPIVEVEVSDTGRGIEHSAQPEIFTGLPQVFVPGSQNEFGGMGLAIAKQIVVQGGGSIQFHSEPGIGSSFWVVVPFGAPEIKVPLARINERLRGKTAFVEIENQSLRIALLHYCESLGLNVAGMNRLKPVSTALPDPKCDLIIRDARSVASAPVDPGVPTLILGLDLAPSSAVLCRHLRKPVRRSELERELVSLIDSQGATGSVSLQRLSSAVETETPHPSSALPTNRSR